LVYKGFQSIFEAGELYVCVKMERVFQTERKDNIVLLHFWINVQILLLVFETNNYLISKLEILDNTSYTLCPFSTQIIQYMKDLLLNEHKLSKL